MEKKFLLFAAGVCMFGVFFSCGKGKGDRQMLDSIEQAWQLCEFSLPEAQARAEGMGDSVRESSKYVRQKYDLLMIRLRDKLDVVPSSPDSALQVLNYFEGRANKVDRERAYYYAASAYRDLKDYPRAVNLFLKAVDEAEKSEAADTLIWQNALSQLRFLYMLQLKYEEELNVALKAVELAKASPDPSQRGEDGSLKRYHNLGCYLMDVASAYADLGDTLRCLQYCDSSYRIIEAEQYHPRYGRILSSMLATYSNCNHYEKVDTLLRHLSQLPKGQRPHNYELCLARFYENQDKTDSAIVHYGIHYYNEGMDLAGRYEASAGLQRCYWQKGDYKSAAWWGQRLYATNDSIIAQRAFEQTERARDEYRYHRDQEAEKAVVQRDERIITASVITGLALLSIILSLFAYYSYRKKKYVEELLGKDKLLEQKAVINKELTRIALMNIATDRAGDVITHFHNIAEGKAKLKDGSWDGLMAAIETLYPEFLDTVQGRMQGSLREPLLRTICLLKIGMKPMQIAKVMDAKIQTVWNRVKRAEEICGDLLTTS